MKVRVDCYSGFKAEERPVRFNLEEHDYFVEEVLDHWYGPDDAYFKVRADDGNLYILRRATSEPEGTWSLESYRQSSSQASRSSG
jgi:hypothetical protein